MDCFTHQRSFVALDQQFCNFHPANKPCVPHFAHIGETKIQNLKPVFKPLFPPSNIVFATKIKNIITDTVLLSYNCCTVCHSPHNPPLIHVNKYQSLYQSDKFITDTFQIVNHPFNMIEMDNCHFDVRLTFSKMKRPFDIITT